MTFGHLQLRLQAASVNHRVRDKTLGMEALLDRPAASTNSKAEHGINRPRKAKTTQPAQPPLQKVTYEPHWFPRLSEAHLLHSLLQKLMEPHPS